MIEATNTFNSQSASRLLAILQSKAGERWDRALEELEGKRLQVEGSFPQFAVTNRSGTRYDVTLNAQGSGTCTCPDLQVRTSREGRLCKHVAAAAISSLVPLIPSPRATSTPRTDASQSASHPAEAATFVLRLRKKIQGEGKDGVEIEVADKLTGDEAQDRQTADAAFQLLSQVADGVPAKREAPAGASAAAGRSRGYSRTQASSAAAKPPASAVESGPVPAVISKIDRMKTRRGDSFFLAVEVGDEVVRFFGTPEELAERLEESGYDIPAGEIQAGMELNLPCAVVLGAGANGYKTIQKFLPESA